MPPVNLPASMPDVTKAQVVAVVGNALAIAAALGFHINAGDQQTIMIAAGGLGTVIVLADALIRRARANALAHMGKQDILKLALEALAYVEKHGKELDPLLGVTDTSKASKAPPPPAFEEGAFGDDPAATHAAGEEAPDRHPLGMQEAGE